MSASKWSLGFLALALDKPMQQEADVFRARGMALTYRVEKGQSHRIETLSGPGAARLFDQFDQDQRGCVTDRRGGRARGRRG